MPAPTDGRRPPRSSGPARPASLDEAAERIGPPVARSQWSPDFPVQAIEVLPVFLAGDAPAWLKPVHARSLQVALPKGRPPAGFVLEVIGWYAVAPRVVHSTSWRVDDERIVLTYLALVEPPVSLPAHSLEALPVRRATLARGEATSAPVDIGVAAVLEHALRHLKWLLADDPAVAAAAPEWSPVLGAYEAEPFRAL